MNRTLKGVGKIMITFTAVVAVLGSIWYGLFGLKSYEITDEQLTQAYAISSDTPKVTITPVNETAFDLSFQSFDGETVNGRIVYPDVPRVDGQYPLLIGLHGMGRAHVRWWQDSFKDRPTLEQTDKLTQIALNKGYAVIALDARNHGERKTPEYSIKNTMIDLKVWGKREPYEALIRDTVKDYRMLLNWLDTQPQFDASKTAAIGYSMGAQMSLLLSAFDGRVEQTLAIVPPYIGQGTALVSPSNAVGHLQGKVWLATADNDDYASQKENKDIFERIATSDKKHLEFKGEHILPEGYYQQLTGWF